MAVRTIALRNRPACCQDYHDVLDAYNGPDKSIVLYPTMLGLDIDTEDGMHRICGQEKGSACWLQIAVVWLIPGDKLKCALQGGGMTVC